MASKRPIPFALVAPATVVLLGAALTLVSTILGIADLSRHARASANFQVSAISKSFAPRVKKTPAPERQLLMERAANNCACVLLLVDSQGIVRNAAPRQPLSFSQLNELASDGGSLLIFEQEYLYNSSSLHADTTRLFVFSPLPDISKQKSALVSSMVAFALVLLVAAGFVGWTLARNVHSDVVFVRDAIVSMAQTTGPTHSKAISVRTIDQVGQLTASFNTLLERFQAAERAYRQDLTEAKGFERDRSAFLSALSHELRTPLNTILGFADVLLHEIDGPLSDESRENITIVRTSGEHLRSLIDDILALSALESGEFSLSREQVDIAQIAFDVVEEARITATQKGLTILLDTPHDPEATTAYADKRRMRQVLSNVIGNAIKFTSQGTVGLKVFRNEEDIVITVSDTGPGIAEAQLDAIFEEFRQAESNNSQQTGTGLGLSICRRLVQMHGGTIHAKSILGTGSTFTIHLPVEFYTRNSSYTELSISTNS